MQPAGAMTIGALAREVGVGVETIRFYQRSGLMPLPPRRHGAVRRYDPTDVARLRFIRTAQGLGFTLQEVAELLALEDGTRCSLARQLAERKLDEVRAKRDALVRIEAALGALVQQCAERRGSIKCPLIASLQAP